MSRILAIDPGSEQSAWVLLVDGRPAAFGKQPNDEVLWYASLREPSGADVVVIEWMAPRGMPTSRQEMETMFWAGRFYEAATWNCDVVERLTRDAVKYHLTGQRSRVNDAVVRTTLIDRFGGVGGRAAAVGTKAAPGPLYGISSDVWAALAVAIAWSEGAR